MENTVALLAKILGATGIESAGHDARMVVEGHGGARLKLSIAGESQRFMATLLDGSGVTRCSIDVMPVTRVREDPATPGRVVLQVGKTLVRIDGKPTLAIELSTIEGG